MGTNQKAQELGRLFAKYRDTRDAILDRIKELDKTEGPREERFKLVLELKNITREMVQWITSNLDIEQEPDEETQSVLDEIHKDQWRIQYEVGEEGQRIKEENQRIKEENQRIKEHNKELEDEQEELLRQITIAKIDRGE